MKILCISVGKKHDSEYAGAISNFETRLKPYCDFSWHLIPTSDVDTESSVILKTIGADDIVVLLDERGISVNNQKLASYLEELQNRSTKRLVIVIGGAYGVNAAVRNRAQAVLSLSKLVFPHQLVRLILVEQLYRSYSILAGSNYHHQ
jgi:23S rRNA (pseudouridine1915-N3)-methyltransferase